MASYRRPGLPSHSVDVDRMLICRTARLALTLACLVLVSSCSSPERSRALGDHKVAATTIAQQVCSTCHGIRGVSTSPNFPNLAAQTPEYIEAQLKSFRSKGRMDPPGFEYMWGISARLTDQQIAGLAAYFSKQGPARMHSIDPQLKQTGQIIFENGIAATGVPACATCHGIRGEGMGQFPRLAGQHADYVVKQLDVFQKTDQRPTGAAMKPIAHALTRENIRSVAAYVQSIQP